MTIICICGLGNPGSEYKLNRHNLGFMLVDLLQDKFGLPKFEKKFSGAISKGEVEGKQIILFKPMLFMNQSGPPLGLISNFYKINLDNLLVIHDELELKFGTIKIKKAGGSAGHNGIRSIDSIVGKDYWRMKVGIGRPEHTGDVANYVLSDFTSNQDLQKLFQTISLNASLLLQDDKESIANKYNFIL